MIQLYIMIKKVYLFFSLVLLASCNNITNTNSLVLSIDAVIQKSDSINLYYTINNTINFNDKQSFWTKVIGNNKNQNINIIFPDSIKPKQIRLDFGLNKKQPEIVLNKFTFSYKNKELSLKGKEIFNTFREDQNTTSLNKLEGSFKRKFFNQTTGPSLYPKGDKLYIILNKLYSEK